MEEEPLTLCFHDPVMGAHSGAHHDPSKEEYQVYLTSFELRNLSDDESLLSMADGNLYRVEVRVDRLTQIVRELWEHPTSEDRSNLAEDLLRILREPARARTKSEGQSLVGFLPGSTVWFVEDDRSTELGSRCPGPWPQGATVVERRNLLDPAASIWLEVLPEPLITVHRCADGIALSGVEEAAVLHGFTWIPIYIDRGAVRVGPWLVPGVTSGWSDVRDRMIIGAQDEQVARALLAPPVLTNMPLPRAEILQRAFEGLASELAGGGSALLHWSQLSFSTSGKAANCQRSIVLPLPNRAAGVSEVRRFGGGQLPNVRLEDLVDDRTGLVVHVQRIEHHPAIPDSLVTYQSFTGAINRLYPWKNSRVCGGSEFCDETAARLASIGEGVERYCGNFIMPERLVRGSWEALAARGLQPVDPEDFVLYSRAQYALPDFPFEPLTKSTELFWHPACQVSDRAEVWIPASLLYVNWHSGPFEAEPPYHYPMFAGIAAGPNWNGASAAGAVECIERDATMAWWHNQIPLPAFAPTPLIEQVWGHGASERGQEYRLIFLSNEFGLPLIAAVLWNHNEGLLNIGFGCRSTAEASALKALTEALTLQEGSRDLDDPNGLYRKAIKDGSLISFDLKPWRKDRRYKDEYRDDYHDVTELFCQQQIFLDPRMQEMVEPFLRTQIVDSLAAIPPAPVKTIEEIGELVQDLGYEVLVADLTTPDVAIAGLAVVRVLIPGLAPNFPAAFPCFGHGRIQLAPVRFGWRETPKAEEELSWVPLPHA